MITKVVIDEDYWIGQMVQKSFDSNINRKCIIGRNEIGVQNMHRQIADIMGYPRFGEMPRGAKPGIAAAG
jgi:hypothetical protein